MVVLLILKKEKRVLFIRVLINARTAGDERRNDHTSLGPPIRVALVVAELQGEGVRRVARRDARHLQSVKMTSFLAMKWQRSKRVSSHSWVHVSRKCRSLSASSSVPQKVALATVREPGFPAGGESFRSPCTRPVCPNLCPLPVPCCKTSTPPAPSRTHMAKPGTQAEKNTNKPPKNKGHALSAKLADRRNSLRTNRKTAKRYLDI